MHKNTSLKNKKAAEACVEKGNWLIRFLRWLLPWKGDRPKTVILKIVFLIFVIAFLVSGGMPVSYTHLDVYKRQT